MNSCILEFKESAWEIVCKALLAETKIAFEEHFHSEKIVFIAWKMRRLFIMALFWKNFSNYSQDKILLRTATFSNNIESLEVYSYLKLDIKRIWENFMKKKKKDNKQFGEEVEDIERK